MSQSELQQLRQLLLNPEQERLDKLEQHAVTPQQRLQELNRLLPSAIEHSDEDGRLADALAKPIKHGLRSAIREDAVGLAEVLFPVMGPSIRRAIAEALRDFVSSFNHTVARAVSWQGMRWRLDALRSGRSYGEVVLSQTLSYRVEQALLIHRDSGLVVSKAELTEVVASDSDAFSAMLGAIQDFVSDSMKGDSALSTLDMGERTIWIIRGPHAHLACIISGLPQPQLREFLADELDEAHNAFGGLLVDFAGDPDTVSGVDRYTQRCIGSPVQTVEQAAPPRWPVVMLLLLLGLLVYWLFASGSGLEPRIRQALQGQPGLVLQSLEHKDGQWHLQILRDPLSGSAQAHLQEAGIELEQVRIQEQAIQSLAPEMVQKRLRTTLAIPDSVDSSLHEGVVVLSGRAPWQWLSRLQQSPVLPAGVVAIDDSRVEVEYGLQALRRNLPEGVSVQVIDNKLQFSGEVELGWIRQLRGWLKDFASLPLAAQQQLQPAEWGQLQALAADIDGQRVYFAEMVQLLDGEREKLDSLRQKLQRVDALSQVLGVSARLTLTAWSDGLGSQVRNREIRTLRAAEVGSQLNPQDKLKLPLVLRAHPDYAESEQSDAQLRRVDLQLQIGPMPEIQP